MFFPCEWTVLRLGAVLSLLALPVLASGAGATNESSESADRLWFSLPAEAAERALKRFSEQSGLELVFPSRIVTGIETRALHGEYLPVEALAMMLEGTGLSAKPSEEARGIVVINSQLPNVPSLPMKLRKLASAFGVAFSASVLLAQSIDDQTTDEVVVTLNPFEVSSSSVTRYQSAMTASGGRIAANIMDTPRQITVLTSEFINDVSPTRVYDAAKYVAGVGESRVPYGQDRINIRGFDTGGRRVDGFNVFDHTNYDHAAIERMEIIKGPDALLHPSGTPGGTINLVTKKPLWDFGGSLDLNIGEYDRNRVALDVTGPLNDQFAYRAVLSALRNKGYADTVEREAVLFSPSLTWRIAPQSSLTLRYEYWSSQISIPVGTLADPSVGTNTPFKLWEGLPRTFSPNFGMDTEYRSGTSHFLSGLFTSAITDRLSVRLSGRVSETASDYAYLLVGTKYETPVPVGWTPMNPLTGNYEPGRLYDPNSPFASIPEPAVSPIFDLSGLRVSPAHFRNRDVQNDWSYIVDADSVKSTTMLGFAYTYQSYNENVRSYTVPSIDVSKGEYRPTGPAVYGPVSSQTRQGTSRYQVYLTEQLQLFNDYLILSGGVAHLSFNAFTGDKLSSGSPPPNPTVPGQMFPGSGSKSTYNYGIVIKPLEQVSIYYGHAENAVPGGDFRQIGLGLAPNFAVGKQDEIGVKGSFFEGRFLASVTYYEIEQTGYSIYDPANASNPPPPVLNYIYVSREVEGWEFQVTSSITPSLSVIASYTDSRNRTPSGQLFTGAAENLASAYLRYEFVQGAVKGLAFAIGANYTSRRAVDFTTEYTRASTLTNLIPIKSSAYLPSHTLVDATISYSRASWSAGITVANLLDKDYIAAADFRNFINVGNPRNISGSVTWKF